MLPGTWHNEDSVGQLLICFSSKLHISIAHNQFLRQGMIRIPEDTAPLLHAKVLLREYEAQSGTEISRQDLTEKSFEN